MKKYYIIPIIAVILILVIARVILPAPEPERCAICDSIPFHAPALVNLATGEVGELAVYDPHPFKVAELNEHQQGGTFSFIYAAGLNGYSDTANWETHITIPRKENEYEEQFFCRTCRDILQDFVQFGFVLVDLYEPSMPQIYSVEDKSEFLMRCYRICVTPIGMKESSISVIGTLKIHND